jgi:hypothetical protein
MAANAPPETWTLPPLPEESPYRLLSFGHVQVQIQVAPITAHNLAIHLAAQSEQLELISRERWKYDPVKVVVLVDGGVSLVPPPEARALQTAWLKKHRNELSLITYKMGFVLPNRLLRAFVNAILFVAPLPVPMTAHATMHDAVRWATREIDSIGGEVSPELRSRGSAAVEAARRAVPSLLAGRAT